MLDNGFIDYLYNRVLHENIMRSRVNMQDIILGIENMKEVYTRNPAWFTSESAPVADFNEVAHRCAYIHKYAPLHTAIVYDVIKRALNNNYIPFKNMVLSSDCLRICSLGGGPGCDVLGVLAALHEIFGFLRVSVSIVDIMRNWDLTFLSVLNELQLPTYGTLGQSFNPEYFDWTYITSNLLGEMSEEVHESIAAADLITMIKFVSAAACETTSDMIKEVFRLMKPGAIVLYVDNDVGKFHELINQAAFSCNFVSVFGPFKREHYRIEDFKKKRFGYTSCFDIKVSIHVWQKPMRHSLPPSSKSTLVSNMQCGKSHSFSCFTDMFPSKSSHLSNEYSIMSLPMNNEAHSLSEEQNNNYKTPSFLATDTFPSKSSSLSNEYSVMSLPMNNGACSFFEDQNNNYKTPSFFATDTFPSKSSPLANEYSIMSLPMNNEACSFSEEQNNNYKTPSFFVNNTPSISSYESSGYLSQCLSEKKNEQNESYNKEKKTKNSFASKTLKSLSFSSRRKPRTVQSSLKPSFWRKMFKNSTSRGLPKNSSQHNELLSNKKNNTAKLRPWLANLSNEACSFSEEQNNNYKMPSFFAADMFPSKSSPLSNEYSIMSLPMNNEACSFSEEQNNNNKTPSFFINNIPSISSYESSGYLSQCLSEKKNKQNGSYNKEKKTKTSFASETLKSLSFSSRRKPRTVQSNLKPSLWRKMFKNSTSRGLPKNSSQHNELLFNKKNNTAKLQPWLANLSNEACSFSEEQNNNYKMPSFFAADMFPSKSSHLSNEYSIMSLPMNNEACSFSEEQNNNNKMPSFFINNTPSISSYESSGYLSQCLSEKKNKQNGSYNKEKKTKNSFASETLKSLSFSSRRKPRTVQSNLKPSLWRKMFKNSTSRGLPKNSSQQNEISSNKKNNTTKLQPWLANLSNRATNFCSFSYKWHPQEHHRSSSSHLLRYRSFNDSSNRRLVVTESLNHETNRSFNDSSNRRVVVTESLNHETDRRFNSSERFQERQYRNIIRINDISYRNVVLCN